eukprot:14309751-Alexandrium_andersonii.AAC.1
MGGRSSPLAGRAGAHEIRYPKGRGLQPLPMAVEAIGAPPTLQPMAAVPIGAPPAPRRWRVVGPATHG